MTEEKQGTGTSPNAKEAPATSTTGKTTTSRGRRPTKSTIGKESSALSVKNKADSSLNLAPARQGLPNNRPVEASKLHVVSTYNTGGGTRPVVSSGIEISGTLTISGNRPIALSHLKISDTYSVMGNRPVASNEIDDPAALMGFLD